VPRVGLTGSWKPGSRGFANRNWHGTTVRPWVRPRGSKSLMMRFTRSIEHPNIPCIAENRFLLLPLKLPVALLTLWCVEFFIFHCTGALSALCYHLLFEKPRQDWNFCCSASSCASLAPPSSSVTRQYPTSSSASRLTQFQPIVPQLVSVALRCALSFCCASRASHCLPLADPTAAHNLLSSRCVQSCPRVS
jgi:hypothetical protein